jgi:hypothetical protein
LTNQAPTCTPTGPDTGCAFAALKFVLAQEFVPEVGMSGARAHVWLRVPSLHFIRGVPRRPFQDTASARMSSLRAGKLSSSEVHASHDKLSCARAARPPGADVVSASVANAHTQISAARPWLEVCTSGCRRIGSPAMHRAFSRGALQELESSDHLLREGRGGELRKKYQQDGYVLLRGLLDPEKVQVPSIPAIP